jgi:ATP phosphoribosyltransferase
MKTLTLAIPSKGRLMEQAAKTLEASGLSIERSSTDRGYRGQLKGIEDIAVAFLSAAEIAQNLRDGKIEFGITGADLLWEKSLPQENLVSVLAPLDFGFANVVVAVPECWLDVLRLISMKCRASMPVMAAGSGLPPVSQSHPGSLLKGRDGLPHLEAWAPPVPLY